MTSSEMVVFFNERYQLSSNFKDDKDDEVYLYLNAAVGRFIKTRFTGNNSRQANFESDQKRVDDLRTLYSKSSALSNISTISEISNGKQFDLPNDYLFLIDGYAEINSNYVPCEKIVNTQKFSFIESSFNIPIIRKPKIFIYTSSKIACLVDPDDFSSFTNLKIDYIRTPNEITVSVNCDLPDHTHEEIVEIAVGLAIEGIENPTRFQTHTDKLNKME
jgi:hypothetical protein